MTSQKYFRETIANNCDARLPIKNIGNWWVNVRFEKLRFVIRSYFRDVFNIIQ